MPTRLSLALVAMMTLCVASLAGASPITYDFSGQFAGPGLNGISQFSGSFTIDGDPTTLTSDSGAFTGVGVYEHASDVSLTVNLGGQVYNFTNQQGPYTTASFAAGLAYSWLAYQAPQDEAIISGSTSSVNGSSGIGLEMSFYSNAASDQLGNLRNFSLPISSSSVYLISSSGYPGAATLTSIELVPTPTPEPSTLVIFGVLGIVATAHRWRRRS